MQTEPGVICDTKIVEDCAAPLSNTLHLPDGTVVERGTFRLRNSDLVDILQACALGHRGAATLMG